MGLVKSKQMAKQTDRREEEAQQKHVPLNYLDNASYSKHLKEQYNNLVQQCIVCLRNSNIDCSVRANCNHIYCLSCLKCVIRNSSELVKCPTCFTSIDTFHLLRSERTNNMDQPDHEEVIVLTDDDDDDELEEDCSQTDEFGHMSCVEDSDDHSEDSSTLESINDHQDDIHDDDWVPKKDRSLSPPQARRFQRMDHSRYEIGYVIDIVAHKGRGNHVMYKAHWTDGRYTWEPRRHFMPTAKATLDRYSKMCRLKRLAKKNLINQNFDAPTSKRID